MAASKMASILADWSADSPSSRWNWGSFHHANPNDCPCTGTPSASTQATSSSLQTQVCLMRKPLKKQLLEGLRHSCCNCLAGDNFLRRGLAAELGQPADGGADEVVRGRCSRRQADRERPLERQPAGGGDLGLRAD